MRLAIRWLVAVLLLAAAALLFLGATPRSRAIMRGSRVAVADDGGARMPRR